MAEVPYLVAPDHDQVIGADLLRLLEREGAGQGKRGDRAAELPGLRRIAPQQAPRRAFRQLRLQGATQLRPPDVRAVVVEQLDIVSAASQPFHQAARLPI